MNNFEENHQEYRRQLQVIIQQLKENDTNIQSNLHDLEWCVKNDLNRLEILGKDAFEDEVEELDKFVQVVNEIKKKYYIHYVIDELSFDDHIDDLQDEEDLYEEDDELDEYFDESENNIKEIE